MSRRYSSEEKTDALVILQNNAYDVATTSVQTGIPQRTLRDWKRELDLDSLSPPPPPQGGSPMAAASPRIETVANNPPPVFAEVEEALEYVQEQIVQEMVAIAHTLKDTLKTASPYHRILAFSQLTDRVEKLHNLIPKTGKEQTLRVEFVNPVTGKTSHNPYWAERDEEEDAY